MLSKLTRHWLVLCASMAACALASAAAAVTELKPSELAAFVARNEYVVVQMTSPDASCTYCIGADKIFDQASALSLDVPIAFARVQWSPWNKYPDFGPLVKVLGMPMQVVFRHGKVIGEAAGRQDHPQTLITRIDAIVHKSAVAKADRNEEARRSPTPTRPAPSAAAMTEGDRAVARVMVRHDLLRGLIAGCTKLFPDQALNYQQALNAWRAARQSALDAAARWMLTRSSRDDAREMTQLVDSEKNALQQWQVQQLGISMRRAPLETDCARMAQNLPAPLGATSSDARTTLTP